MKFAKEEIEKAIAYSVKKMDYEELRQELRKAVTEFIGGHDTFVSLPTGYGKSLCYGLLPHAFDYLRSGDEGRKSGQLYFCLSTLSISITIR